MSAEDHVERVKVALLKANNKLLYFKAAISINDNEEAAKVRNDLHDMLDGFLDQEMRECKKT